MEAHHNSPSECAFLIFHNNKACKKEAAFASYQLGKEFALEETAAGNSGTAVFGILNSASKALWKSILF